jgi:hypothetical protein
MKPDPIMAYIDRTALKAISDYRNGLHKDQQSSRPLSKDYELIGICGEAAFSAATGIPIDLTSRVDGDKGIDFTTPVGTVDVKTARKPYYLAVEQGKVIADIYVLAQYDDETRRARLLGWEYGSAFRNLPTRGFGFGIISHYKDVKHLRFIGELIALIQGARRIVDVLDENRR